LATGQRLCGGKQKIPEKFAEKQGMRDFSKSAHFLQNIVSTGRGGS
jgi:hypothetical protein